MKILSQSGHLRLKIALLFSVFFFCRGCFNLNDLCCTGKWNNIDYDEIFLFSELFPFFWKKTFFRGKLIFFSKRKISQNPPNWLPMPGAILEVLDWYVFEQKNTLQKNNKNLKNQQIRKKKSKKKNVVRIDLGPLPRATAVIWCPKLICILGVPISTTKFQLPGTGNQVKKK